MIDAGAKIIDDRHWETQVMSTSGNPPNAGQPNTAPDSHAGANTAEPVDHSPRARAERILTDITPQNATLDNLHELVDLVEEATHAAPRDIADFFAQPMGAAVDWGGTNKVRFKNESNLISWKNVQSHGETITMSHAFAAVSMRILPYHQNAFINHTADIADGVIKGLIPVFSDHELPRAAQVLLAASPALAIGAYVSTANWKKFSMSYGYGRANALGDWFGDWLAVHLMRGFTLAGAFQATRKIMNL